MHEMQTIVTDDRGVCLSVCLSRGYTRLWYAKTVEVLFGVTVKTLGGPRKIVLDGGPDPPTVRGGESANYFSFLFY